MSAVERAFSTVQTLLATSPPLKRGMFALDPSVIQPWSSKPQEPSNPYTVDTSDTVLTPDGLMWAETKDDFFRTSEDSGRALVSRSVAERLGIAEPKLDAEGNAITARPAVRTYTAPSSSVPHKRPRTPEPVPEPQAGGSAAAAAVELAAGGLAEKRIASDDLPEVLLVRARWNFYLDYHYNRTDAGWDPADEDEETMMYVRVLPPPRPFDEGEIDAQPKLGFACIDGDGPIGRGNSGAAWKCVFAPDVSTDGQACFKAVAKVENVSPGGLYRKDRVKQFMRDEAQTYTAFPDWMSDDHTGYAVVPKIDTPQPVSAIVPKFYGLYARADGRCSLERQLQRMQQSAKAQDAAPKPSSNDDDTAGGEAPATQVPDDETTSGIGNIVHGNAESGDGGVSDLDAKIDCTPSESPSACDPPPTIVGSEGACQQTADVSNDQQQGAQAVGGSQAGPGAEEGAGPTATASPTWRVTKLSQPILLMEDCGQPIVPCMLSEDEKKEIYSMVVRLHHSGFMQNSPYERNIVQRTEEADTEGGKPRKKFRMIDFGRGALIEQSRWTPDYQEGEVLEVLELDLKA
ncbi:hypothetical protein AURDEDRAFT_129027 [Auricularia subglabra TFB-10046 SS5]|nr:hypothetical protein AURDEDRAFT_129027 [Auricularia subglabra TFB-10046 SS5]